MVAVSAEHCLQLLGDPTAIFAFLLHQWHNTARISQSQQIVLYRQVRSESPTLTRYYSRLS